MDPPALDGYLREVCQQCWLALLASMQLRDLWLARHPDPDMDFDVSPAGGSERHAPDAARWMDPDTWVVWTFGTGIDLSGIVEEASRLQALATDLGSVWPLAGVRSSW